jgi:predicted RNA polymerase sigma factor
LSGFTIFWRECCPFLIVSLNRAVAVAMVDGPRPALVLVTNASERRFLERRLREVQSAVA